ncbi:MAG TPA: hypothetical protein VG225_09260 [Terracidiphilus sp.]|jgi:hypothetical protein|nr:hypothetical protein [Terracidiphilus sp.]
MNIRLITAAALVLCGFSSSSFGQPEPLSAPTYYISIRAQHEYDQVIRVRGASNLPHGARVSLQVLAMNGDAWKTYSESKCVAINDKGLFDQEINLSVGDHYRSSLLVMATFLPNECTQNAHVLHMLGSHGEFLGHDDHRVTMDEVENGETRGMAENPQLFQVSGWYFGISALARIEG